MLGEQPRFNRRMKHNKKKKVVQPKIDYDNEQVSEQERKDEEDFNNEDHYMNFGERPMPVRNTR